MLWVASFWGLDAYLPIWILFALDFCCHIVSSAYRNRKSESLFMKQNRPTLNIHGTSQGWIQRFWKGVALYIGHHSWPTKKTLGSWWSKKAKITLETVSFWQNISISIFKFYPFLYTMKACQWNLINFSKFTNTLIRKEKKHLCSSQ